MPLLINRASILDLPPNGNNGDLAVVLDNLGLYVFNASTVNWELIVAGGAEVLWDKTAGVISPNTATDTLQVTSEDKVLLLQVDDTAGPGTASVTIDPGPGDPSVELKVDAFGSIDRIQVLSGLLRFSANSVEQLNIADGQINFDPNVVLRFGVGASPATPFKFLSGTGNVGSQINYAFDTSNAVSGTVLHSAWTKANGATTLMTLDGFGFLSVGGLLNTPAGDFGFASSVVNGASAKAYKFNTSNLLSTAGSLHTIWRNQGSEIMSLGFSGLLTMQKAVNFKRKALAVSGATTGETIIGVTSTAAARTITLATADVIAGRVIFIKDESGLAGTNNITIDTEGAELIDGAASIAITVNYGVLKVYSDGVNWFTL